MAEIKNFDLGHLHQEESFGFHQIAKGETAKCNDPKLTDLQAAYALAFNQFDVSLKQGGGENYLTSPIARLDEERDNAYRGFANHVRNMKAHFDPQKAEIARQAWLIINKYGDPCELPYLAENGVIYNLIQELEVFDNKKDDGEHPDELAINTDEDRLLLIGAREWLEQLKSLNELFVITFSDRNTGQAAIVTGATKAARQLVDKAYRNVVVRINALAEVNGDAAYIDAINAINTLIGRQRAIMAARKTNNAKKKEEKPGENPDEKPDEL